MDPGQIGMGVGLAFKQGREDRRAYETENALAAYAKNQTPETAAAITQHDPRLGIQLQDREEDRAAAAQKQQEEIRKRQTITLALTGDPSDPATQQARASLAYYNTGLYLNLDAADRKRVDDAYGVLAQHAFNILPLPEAEQGPAIQEVLADMQAQGGDISKLGLTGNPQFDLKKALAVAGKLEAWERFAQIQYQQQGTMPSFPTRFGKPLGTDDLGTYDPSLWLDDDAGDGSGNAAGGF